MLGFAAVDHSLLIADGLAVERGSGLSERERVPEQLVAARHRVDYPAGERLGCGVTVSGQCGVRGGGARQSVGQDRPHALVEGEADLDLVDAPVASVLAHHAVIEGAGQQRPARERVAVYRADRVHRKDQQAPDRTLQLSKGGFVLVAEGLEPCEVQAVAEELALARQHDREGPLDRLELVEDLVEPGQGIVVYPVLALVPGHQGDVIVSGQRDAHYASIRPDKPRGKLASVNENDSSISEPDVTAENPVSEHWVWTGHHRPASPRVLVEHMTNNWKSGDPVIEVHEGAANAAARRKKLGEHFAGRTLVVPTGTYKVRANDTDYRFRAGTDFFYLTACLEPDAVLIIAPSASGPRSTLYFPPRRDHQTHEFFTDARYGELWVGPRRGVIEAAGYYDIETAPLEHLEKDLASLRSTEIVTLRGFDASVDALIDPSDADAELATVLSEQRLIKDDFEVAQLQLAIDYTIKGFEDVVRALPTAEGRGERVVEGVFNLRARVEGNDVGYDTIAASGAHATILHWTRNDGAVRRGDLLLLDAGVECHNLYTADVTRTMPIDGTFSPAQRTVYELVLAAQEAGIAAVRPGASFMAPHDAAMQILAEGLHSLGILQEEPELALRRDRQLHRRYTLHGTSHMLGIDVHDCANARDEIFRGNLEVGYVLTVEPGLYFQKKDLTVPEEFRGIGVRIEDDILVTANGSRNLSSGLPRQVEEIEAWMAALWSQGSAVLGL